MIHESPALTKSAATGPAQPLNPSSGTGLAFVHSIPCRVTLGSGVAKGLFHLLTQCSQTRATRPRPPQAVDDSLADGP